MAKDSMAYMPQTKSLDIQLLLSPTKVGAFKKIRGSNPEVETAFYRQVKSNSSVVLKLNDLDVANKKKIENEVIKSLASPDSLTTTLDISGYQPALGDVFFEAIGHSRIHTLRMEGVNLSGCQNFHKHLAVSKYLKNLYMSETIFPCYRLEIVEILIGGALQKLDITRTMGPKELYEGDLWEKSPNPAEFIIAVRKAIFSDVRNTRESFSKSVTKGRLVKELTPFFSSDTIDIIGAFLIDDYDNCVALVGSGDDFFEHIHDPEVIGFKI